MPRAVDRKTLAISHDPNYMPEFSLHEAMQQGVDMWKVLLESIKEHIEGLVREVISKLLGIAIDPEQALEDALAALANWALNIPGAELIVAAITGVAGGLSKLGEYFDNFRAFMNGLDFTQPDFNPLDAARVFVTNVIRPFLSTIFAWVRPEWLPQVSLFSIGDSQPNLLAEGDFRDLITLDGGGHYWDGTDGRTVNGCAAVNADGVDHVIVSNPVPVSEEQKLNCGGHVSHAGAYGTDIIEISLITYLDNTIVSTHVLGTLSPSGDDTDWSQSISGTYTVPSGVDAVAMQLRVTSGATAGVVKFDDCWVKKQQLLKIPFIDTLETVLSTAAAKVQDIIDRIINAFQNFGELIDTVLPVGGILDAIFGIFDTGLTANNRTLAIETRIKALESAANTIMLDFNGPSANSPGAEFAEKASGGGAGDVGPNGKGAVVWKPNGAGNRTKLYRYTGSALNTDACVLEWVLASSPQSYIFDDAFTYVLARMNGFTDNVRVRSGFDNIRIQATVASAVSNIGPAWSGNPKAGDAFAWYIGESGAFNLRHHVLTRNGVTILDFSETTSVVGASNRHIGFGMETGNRLVITQNIPAGLGVLTAAEVL